VHIKKYNKIVNTIENYKSFSIFFTWNALIQTRKWISYCMHLSFCWLAQESCLMEDHHLTLISGISRILCQLYNGFMCGTCKCWIHDTLAIIPIKILEYNILYMPPNSATVESYILPGAFTAATITIPPGWVLSSTNICICLQKWCQFGLLSSVFCQQMQTYWVTAKCASRPPICMFALVCRIDCRVFPRLCLSKLLSKDILTWS